MRRWMRVVGSIYMLLGLGFVPPLNEARAEAAFSFVEGYESTQLFKAFIDYSFAFGLDLLVIGGFLWWASTRAAEHRWMVWLVVWLEGVRGIVGDVWVLQRGYDAAANAVWVGFLAFHMVVIVTGIRALRSAERSVDVLAATS